MLSKHVLQPRCYRQVCQFPVVMKIGGWKKTSTMDIYLRLAGVDTKGATESLGFVPEAIEFGDNVVSIFSRT